MIWLICAIFSLSIVFWGIATFLNKRRNSLRMLYVLVSVFISTYIIYFPPHISEYGLFHGAIGTFVRVLQVATVDADAMQFFAVIEAGTGNEIFTKAYMLLLGFLHIMLPAMFATTAVTVLLRCFSSLQLFFANGHKKPMFVFSEVNEKTLQIAKSLEGIKCDVVFASCIEDAISEEMKSNIRYIFKEERIFELDIKGKKGKDIYFFCVSEDEDELLTCSLKLIEKYAECSESEQEHIHIYQIAKEQDFAIYIDSANKGFLDVQCRNEHEMLVYKLLNEYPLTMCGKKDIHVLLYGMSSVNVAALRAVAWCGQLCGFSLRVSVVGINTEKKEAELRSSFPGLFSERYNISFYNCKNDEERIEKVKEKCFDANYIIVSEESDNEAMHSGVRLRRLFYCADSSFSYCPKIFCHTKELAKFNILKELSTAESNPKRKMSYDLIPFGKLDEIYSYKNLVDSEIEKMAKNVHLAYEEIFSDGEIDVKKALAGYNVFEVNKRSNRANALHIRYKLNLLGLDYTDDENAEPVSMHDYYTEDGIRKLAISEHNRWMAFLETEGWEPSSREEVIAYRESGISRGRHNCPILKRHPYICEYEKLKDLSLELEGKDTAVYDTELILRIPDILGDKWNVNGKKYKIVKIDKQQEV